MSTQILSDIQDSQQKTIDLIMTHTKLLSKKGMGFTSEDREILLSAISIITRCEVQATIMRILDVVRVYKEKWMSIDTATKKSVRRFCETLFTSLKKVNNEQR